MKDIDHFKNIFFSVSELILSISFYHVINDLQSVGDYGLTFKVGWIKYLTSVVRRVLTPTGSVWSEAGDGSSLLPKALDTLDDTEEV